MDLALLVSAVVNVLLVILAIVLGKHGYDLNRLLQNTSKKLGLIQKLIADFLEAYQDKVLTKEEALKLYKDLEEIVSDP